MDPFQLVTVSGTFVNIFGPLVYGNDKRGLMGQTTCPSMTPCLTA